MTSSLNKGRLIAKVLTHSWRASTSALEVSNEELDIVAPMLLESGAGALGWKRVNNSNLRNTPAALELEQAYRLHALQSAIHEREIEDALALLRSAGVEPILVKGWAVARLYPEVGLRPYGDLDLCVAAKQYHLARKALEKDFTKSHQVDLHRGFKTLDHKSWDELWSHSHLVKLDDLEVPSSARKIICACSAFTSCVKGPGVRCGCAISRSLLRRASQTLIGISSPASRTVAENGLPAPSRWQINCLAPTWTASRKRSARDNCQAGFFLPF
jgi:hypothetical protein